MAEPTTNKACRADVSKQSNFMAQRKSLKAYTLKVLPAYIFSQYVFVAYIERKSVISTLALRCWISGGEEIGTVNP
jgi:hypothetical protein